MFCSKFVNSCNKVNFINRPLNYIISSIKDNQPYLSCRALIRSIGYKVQKRCLFTLSLATHSSNKYFYRINSVDNQRYLPDRKMSKAILYKADLSPPARAVMMTLDLLGLDFEMRDLNPVLREQDEPDFVKKNPMRTIPILEEGDFTLSDSHAIIIYLLEKYGKPEHSYLYPEDKRTRARIHQRMFLDCGIIFPRLRAVMAPTYAGRLTELSKFMIINIEDAYRMLEDYLSQTLYLADDTLTIADFSVFTTTSTLNELVGVDEKRFPILKQWLNNMSQIDVCKRINENNSKLQALMLVRIMEHNKENKMAKPQAKL